MINQRLLTAIACAAVLHGCGRPSLLTSEPHATPAARFALGKAAPYPAQQFTNVERAHMAHSYLERRKRAWDIVQKVTAPTSIDHNGRGVERWTTWYGRDDYERMFAYGFTRLSPSERRARAPISTDIAAASEDYLATQITEDPLWSADRRAAFISSLRTNEDWTGLAGIGRVLFSPTTLIHTMLSYQQVTTCNVVPLQACILEFQPDAVIIKTAWVRSELGLGIPAFETNGDALSQRLSVNGQSWDHPDRIVSTISGRAIEQRTQAGSTFQLAGMHIMSKESKDWMWITLWWSDDPDSDFGEDRPASLNQNRWANYKMCVITEYSESALDLEDVRIQYPSLASALNAATDDSQMSWCSNPYIEKGVDNQKTNCIGCHQYAGVPEMTPERVMQLPTHGREKTRSDFPADYLWTLTLGHESMRHKMQEQVRYYSMINL